MRGTNFLSPESFFQNQKDKKGRPLLLDLNEATREEHWKRVKSSRPQKTDDTQFFKMRPPQNAKKLHPDSIPMGTLYSKSLKDHYVCFDQDGKKIWVLMGPFIDEGGTARVKMGWVLNPDYPGPRRVALKIISMKDPQYHKNGTPVSFAPIAQTENKIYTDLKKRMPALFGNFLYGSRFSISKKLFRSNVVKERTMMGEKYYLLLPYAGPDLVKIINRQNEMSPEQAFTILMHLSDQLIDQIREFHAWGLRQGDLKVDSVGALNDPSQQNVKIGIFDFGLSAPYSDVHRIPYPQPEARIGTPDYFAPEAWVHQSAFLKDLLAHYPECHPHTVLKKNAPILYAKLQNELERRDATWETMSQVLQSPDGLCDWRMAETYQVGYIIIIMINRFFPDIELKEADRNPESKFSKLLPECQHALQMLLLVAFGLTRLLPDNRMNLADASQDVKDIMAEFDDALPDFDPDKAAYVGSAASDDTVLEADEAAAAIEAGGAAYVSSSQTTHVSRSGLAQPPEGKKSELALKRLLLS